MDAGISCVGFIAGRILDAGIGCVGLIDWRMLETGIEGWGYDWEGGLERKLTSYQLHRITSG